MNEDYSYLKPTIAAHMPAAVAWFIALNGVARYHFASELGLCQSGRLVAGWRDIVIERYARKLAYGGAP